MTRDRLVSDPPLTPDEVRSRAAKYAYADCDRQGVELVARRWRPGVGDVGTSGRRDAWTSDGLRPRPVSRWPGSAELVAVEPVVVEPVVVAASS